MAPALTALHHPWGGFAPGTLIRTQTITRTFQGDKTYSNTTERVTVLDSIAKSEIGLKLSAALELGGKRFDANPQWRRYDFFQQPVVEEQNVFALPPSQVQIGLHILPCYVRLYESQNDAWKQQTTIWYSDTVYPYLLRSETIRSSLPNASEPKGKVLSRTVMSILETGALLGPRRQRLGAYTRQTVRETGGNRTITLASCRMTMPGGMLNETSKEFDGTGKLLRQTDTCVIRPEPVYTGVSETIPTVKFESQGFHPQHEQTGRPRSPVTPAPEKPQPPPEDTQAPALPGIPAATEKETSSEKEE